MLQNSYRNSVRAQIKRYEGPERPSARAVLFGNAARLKAKQDLPSKSGLNLTSTLETPKVKKNICFCLHFFSMRMLCGNILQEFENRAETFADARRQKIRNILSRAL